MQNETPVGLISKLKMSHSGATRWCGKCFWYLQATKPLVRTDDGPPPRWTTHNMWFLVWGDTLCQLHPFFALCVCVWGGGQSWKWTFTVTLKIQIVLLFFSIPVPVIIYSDCFGVSCQVFETKKKIVEASAFFSINGSRWHSSVVTLCQTTKQNKI